MEADYLGRAKINYDKCVSCGMCIVNCPFGAIADKSQIYQLIRAIMDGQEIIAAIAPAFVGQFGPMATPEKMKEALERDQAESQTETISFQISTVLKQQSG